MKKLAFFIITFISINALASELKLSKPMLYIENGSAYTIFNIDWENAWHNTKNHDAVWLFFKSLKGDLGTDHISLLQKKHKIVAIYKAEGLELEIEVTEDGKGLFIFPKNNYRGHVKATLRIGLDPVSFKNIDTRKSNFSVYGVEMVKITEGAFTLGDPDTSALEYGGFYYSDASGHYNSLFKINTEEQIITIGGKKGQLYYRSPGSYEGDRKGIIPEDFPKGVNSFYIMKYELTQKQYADFLNSLSENQSQHRVNFGGKNYYMKGGSIVYANGKYYVQNSSAPCNYTSWDDAMAYADWACLRPMSEFEYTKASRGSSKPIKNEFSWGTGSKDKLQRFISENGELIMLNNWDESKLSDKTRDVFGAS